MSTFLTGGGECGALIASRDWSATLGRVEDWPRSLKAAVGLVLRSPVPMVMLWGADGIMLYNDGYSVFAGGRHPELLGSKVREGWPEVAEFNDRVMKVCLDGGTLSFKDQELTLHRNGEPERVSMDLDYSPVLGDDGLPAGVLAIVIETTQRVRANAALQASEARLRDVLNNMGESFVLLDHDFKVIDINPEALRGDGREASEIVGRSHWEIWPGTENSLQGQLYKRAAEQCLPLQAEIYHEWPDGRGVWYEVRANPIRQGLAIFYRDISESRRTDERLRETARRLDAIINNTRMAIFVMDERQHCVFANKAAEELTGYSLDQMQGRPLHDVVHHKYPDGRPYPLEECPIDRAFPERAQVDGEELFVAPDGSFYPVAFTASPVLDEDGKPIGTIIEVRDITEERARDAALQESEQRFRNMADHAPVMMWVTEPNGLCSYLNRAWYDFTGQTESQALGLGWLDAAHPDDREEAERVFIEANRRAEPFRLEYRLLRHDGQYRWAIDAASPRFGPGGDFVGYVGSVIDIDARREVEDALRDSEARLRAVIEQMPIGVAVARIPSGEIIQYNEALEDILGHSVLSEDTSSYDRYGGIDENGGTLPAERYPLYRAVAHLETVVNDEMRYRRGDGRIIDLLGNAAPIMGASGRAEIAVVTLQDITDRKKAEQHQRLLIDELSHRAKNLLAIIQSVAQQSFKGEGSPAELVSRFEGRLGALAAAHGILTKQKWEAAPIRQVICDTITAVKADDERLKLDGPDIMLAPKTAVSLAMAVHELATNAVKYGSFSTEQGSLTVVWSVSDGRLRLEWRERGGPKVDPPTRRGFGSRMIERGLAAELGGQVRIDFQPEGVICTVNAPFVEASA